MVSLRFERALRLRGLGAVSEVLGGVVATSVRVLGIALGPSASSSSRRPALAASCGSSSSKGSSSEGTSGGTSDGLGQQTQSAGSFNGTSQEFLDGKDDSQDQSDLRHNQSLDGQQSDSSEEQGQQSEQLASDSQNQRAQDLLQLLACKYRECVRACQRGKGRDRKGVPPRVESRVCVQELCQGEVRLLVVGLAARYGPFFSSLPSSMERAMVSVASSGSLNWIERAVNRRLADSMAISNRASPFSSPAGSELTISFSDTDLPMRSTGALGSLQNDVNWSNKFEAFVTLNEIA